MALGDSGNGLWGVKAVIYLKRSLDAWDSQAFNEVFQAEVEQLPATVLPLQQGLAFSSAVADEAFRIVPLGAEERPGGLRVRAAVFYSGIVAGCNCADDPTPLELQQEHCELEFIIERGTAGVRVRLLAD